MVTFARNTGRLVEIRDDGVSRTGAGRVPFTRILTLADELGPNAKVIVCADLRLARPIAPEHADKVGLVVRTSLTRVERGVTLLPSAAVAGMQFGRVFGEAHRGIGTIVGTVQQALDALDDVLTAAERLRLRAFLG